MVAVFIYFIYPKISKSAPAALTLPIPFTTQAPNGNWTGNENCEEASSVMANAYLTGDTENIIPAATAQTGINVLLQWEQANLGHSANTGAAQTADMIQSIFHLHVKQVNNYSADDLKKALANHNPVLLMIDASKLGNPTYEGKGSLYHVIVVRGYNAKGFVVNDPGTEKGEGQVYAFAMLDAAAADWNQSTHSIQPGTKIALVVSK